RAAAFAVTARAARLRSAKADLLPRFGIQFLGQNGRIDLGGLPGFGGTGGLAGISAWVPVFNAGRLRARVAMGDAELVAA
ncbi:TolC family protein, partial [Shigella sonnei]|uniref:TolC family protein n=2 Tax=Pseudomonadota TaxID=1224 RepID=UPI001494B1CA